ncbi:unnamed protein product [Peronospora farinosa]|uniref:WW domain-containing protein n=1 Tax=Peronospora farinosa TaxID=134698 RepID=A0AAV0TUU1_9STRA|nr:unnamed protein product [Peronospora farinosa]
MNQYGPPSNGTAFPRNGPPPFRGPPQAFPRGGPPLFRPPLAARGLPPIFAFRGPPPAFQGRGISPIQGSLPPGIAQPPHGLYIPPSRMTTPGLQAPPSPATSVGPRGWNEFRPGQGAPYYYNTAVMESNSSKWLEYKDEATGALYYFNTVTKETVWDQPEEFRMQKAREQVAKMTSETLHTTSFPMTTQVQTSVQSMQDSEQEKSRALTEKEEEENQEDMKRQEIQDKARKKRKEEQEREQAATFEKMLVAERLAAFKQFLEDKQITPTLKWGDAQRLIGKDSSMHSDPRWKFALNTVGEKKQAFAEYCTQAKNRATIEKRRLVKKTREQFTELLGLFESTLAPPSRRRQVSWEELAASNNFYSLRNDPRWSAVEEIRERQQLFATFMQDLERNQKARLAKQRDAMHRAFTELLRQRVDSKQLEFGSSRSSKRLDADTKCRVLDLLREVELPDGGGKVGDDALRIVDRHDVYNWAEEFLHERRELEHAKRKRERVDRVERQEKMSRELNERFKDFVVVQKLTAGSTWEEFSTEHLRQTNEEPAIESKSEVDGGTEAGGDDEGNEDGDDKHLLHWKEQRHLFEKYTRRLRRNLEPVASVLRKYLDRRGDPPLRVTETTSYAVFIDALKNGVSIALDNNAPEEGEEKVIEKSNDVITGTLEDHDDGSATGETEEVKKLNPDEVDAALESAVNKHREMNDNDATVEFPVFVRQVYEMWVALAKEDGMREKEKKLKHRKRSRKESRNVTNEDDDGDEDRPCRVRRRSSALEEVEDDENTKKRRSHRSSRKRHRSHGSPSVSRSRSRSRSVSRRDSSSYRRSRNRSRDCEGALPPGLAAVSLKPIVGTMTARQKIPFKSLSEAEEAAKAEEIIRQARLKLQAKITTTTTNDSELEDGEELEEGEEGEE